MIPEISWLGEFNQKVSGPWAHGGGSGGSVLTPPPLVKTVLISLPRTNPIDIILLIKINKTYTKDKLEYEISLILE